MAFKRLRDVSLGFKLWLMFVCLVVPCLLALSLAFKFILDFTRDQEIFIKIQDAQQLLQNGSAARNTVKTENYDPSISVYSFGISGGKIQYMSLPDTHYQGLLTPMFNDMGTSFSEQTAAVKKYKKVTSGYTLYYIVKKNGREGIVSFMVDVPLDGVYKMSFYVILAFTAGAVLLAMLFAVIFLRVILKPLKKLEKSAEAMAGGDFNTKIESGRGDEIGRLADVMENTREKLRQRDLLRQSTVQYVSHELKTPVMTIESYAQSILDRVYPRGGLEGSVKIILSQSARLQQLILKLLTVTKLDYMETRPPEISAFDVAELTEDAALRCGSARPEVEISLDLQNCTIRSSREEIGVLLENLFENAVRHAAGTVKASVSPKNGSVIFTIFNDGGGIDPAVMPHLFDVFRKGGGGVTGLGLSIVKRVGDRCGAKITAENVPGEGDSAGARFTVAFPAADGKPVKEV